jgi:putative redox protein
MPSITVNHVDADAFTIAVRDHHLTVDQPVGDGGSDAGPTPTELFVASLAGCVAFYARRYLARHALPEQGLQVLTEYAMTSRPARVERIRIRLVLPPGVPDERREALLAVASHCTVHNSLTSPPTVSVDAAPSS